MPAVEGWDSFYILVGSSAGALIGLQFVVITLIADTPLARIDSQAGATFGTPTVVHFGVVLFLSAVVNAPWSGIEPIAAIWALTGLSGIAYEVFLARRMGVQSVYKPVLEDWLFHVLLPLGAYAALVISACSACSHERRALFLAAASSLLLLFVGIHNAWDAVTYHVFVQKLQLRDKEEGPKAKE
jgi:hypothetical protein